MKSKGRKKNCPRITPYQTNHAADEASRQGRDVGTGQALITPNTERARNLNGGLRQEGSAFAGKLRRDKAAGKQGAGVRFQVSERRKRRAMFK